MEAMLGQSVMGALRRWRWVLRAGASVHGIASWLAFAITSLLLAIVVDWLVPLPGIVRVCFGGTLLVILAGSAVRRVFRPLFGRLDLGQVAAAIDRRCAASSDVISTALSIAPVDGRELSPLELRTVRQAVGQLGTVGLRQVISPVRPGRSAGLLLAGVGLLCGLSWGVPDWLETGTRRFLMPFSDARWPCRVEIQNVSGRCVAAMGEPLSLEMRLVRGDSPRRRAWTVMRDRQGRLTRHAMSRMSDASFAYTVPVGLF